MDGIKFLYIRGDSHQVLSEPLSEAEDLKFIKSGGIIFQIKGEVLGRKAVQSCTEWYLKDSKSCKHSVTSFHFEINEF